MNDREDEERDGSGARQAVHRANNERPQRLIKFRAAKPAIELRRRNSFFGMTLARGLVAVGVAVHIIAVKMRVLVEGIVICSAATFSTARKVARNSARRAGST